MKRLFTISAIVLCGIVMLGSRTNAGEDTAPDVRAFPTGTIRDYVTPAGRFDSERVKAGHTGGIWAPLGSGMNSWVRCLTVFDGKLIAGGDFSVAGGVSANKIAAWDGTSWSALGSGLAAGSMFPLLFDVAVYDGRLIAAGFFITAGGVFARGIAAWNGSSWSPIGSGWGSPCEGTSHVTALAVYDNKLIASFALHSGQVCSFNRIAAWDGSTWTSLGSGINGGVDDFAIYNNKLVACGMFTVAGGVPVNNIAAWDGSNWSSLGYYQTDSIIIAATIYNNNLIVAGVTFIPGGYEESQLSTWNGSYWSPLISGISGMVEVLAIYDNRLIVGGSFTSIDDIGVNGIAVWDGSNWAPFGSGVTGGSVSAVTVYDDKLIAGGSFSAAGGVAALNIAAWEDNALPERQYTIRDGSPSNAPIPNKEFEFIKITLPQMSEQVMGKLTTDEAGTVQVPINWFAVGDLMKVQRLVHTQPARKHTTIMPTMFNVYLDNATFDVEDGDILFEVVKDNPVQDITLGHTTLVYDLLVSVEWDAELPFLQGLESDFRNMSNYLYDVFDGQVRLGTISIYDDREQWEEADLLIHADNVLRAYAGLAGIGNSLPITGTPINVPRYMYGGWNEDIYRSMSAHPGWYTPGELWDIRGKAHELGHYAFGFSDEYIFVPCWEWYGLCRCPDIANYGFMDDPFDLDGGSELSTGHDYLSLRCQNTLQFVIHRRSCWDLFDYLFDQTRDGILTPIFRPSERDLPSGEWTFAGPNSWPDLNYDVGQLVLFPQQQQEPNAVEKIALVAYTPLIGPERFLSKSKVTLHRGSSSIYQGKTNDEGRIRILGYEPGDCLTATCPEFIRKVRTWFYGEVGTAGCGVSSDRGFSLVDSDTLSLSMQPVVGDYPMIAMMEEQVGGLRYSLVMASSYPTTPSLELNPECGGNYFYDAEYSSDGYTFTVTDSICSAGTFTTRANDDSGHTFFITTDYTVWADTLHNPTIVGPGGAVYIDIDSMNEDLQKLTILSSSYPVLQAGLYANLLQGGDVYSISWLPAVQLTGNNSIAINYAESDLLQGADSTNLEHLLRVFRWDDNEGEWSIVPSTVDTARNLVTGEIFESGTYGAFTISGCCTGRVGDANGSNESTDEVTLGDIMLLVDVKFISGDCSKLPCIAEADVNQDGGANPNCDDHVTLGDIMTLVDFLFITGPENAVLPQCL